MDFKLSRSLRKGSPDSHRADTLNMAPLSILPSPQRFMQNPRNSQFSNALLGSRSPSDRIELPSIRQAVPEIEFGNRRAGSSDYADHPSLEALNKRGWVSSQEDWAFSPRNHSAPQDIQALGLALSPDRPASEILQEKWNLTSRDSPYSDSRSPPFPSPGNTFRPTLPSLPSMTLERGVSASSNRSDWPESVLISSRPGSQIYSQYPSPSLLPPASIAALSISSDSHGYEQQRGTSHSGSNMHSQSHRHERSPFSAQGYSLDRNDGGAPGGAVEVTKLRKRRGNLPKETTDMLRAWFKAHLHHPYPTEEEKQELMRQTKLQMNQISNWFINARRRQLPTMINNARVESDARLNRADDSTLPMTDRESSEEEKRGMIASESGSEGGYEDEFEMMNRERSGEMAVMQQMRI